MNGIRLLNIMKELILPSNPVYPLSDATPKSVSSHSKTLPLEIILSIAEYLPPNTINELLLASKKVRRTMIFYERLIIAIKDKSVYTNDMAFIRKKYTQYCVTIDDSNKGNISSILKNRVIYFDNFKVLNECFNVFNVNLFQTVKLMLLNCTPRDSDVFERICERSLVDIAVLLLQDGRVDISSNESMALRISCEKGNTEIVYLLLRHAGLMGSHLVAKGTELSLGASGLDPSAKMNYCIRFACTSGHLEIVKLLLDYGNVDPSVCENLCYRYAEKYGHGEICDLLLNDQRVRDSLSL
jgi:hypothetical protein